MVEHADAPRQDNPAVSHESSDVDLRRITYWGVGLTAAVVLILVMLFWLFSFFSKRESRLGHDPVGIRQSTPPTTGPPLQLSPRSEMAEMRAAEDKILQSYGWIDQQKGVVRIPIERAMELTAERGLPARKK
jgi:hypothetical protein